MDNDDKLNVLEDKVWAILYELASNNSTHPHYLQFKMEKLHRLYRRYREGLDVL